MTASVVKSGSALGETAAGGFWLRARATEERCLRVCAVWRDSQRRRQFRGDIHRIHTQKSTRCTKVEERRDKDAFSMNYSSTVDSCTKYVQSKSNKRFCMLINEGIKGAGWPRFTPFPCGLHTSILNTQTCASWGLDVTNHRLQAECMTELILIRCHLF